MDNVNYYEKYDWDKANLSAKLKDKIEKLFPVIPDDVNSILDVGCGDGVISNAFSEKYSVVSTDRSFNAVKHVNTTKFQSSADLLPVNNNSFDLVFSSEMLEHLPQSIFNSAIEEFKRVSRKYILLTFPNNENIEKHFVKCSECKHIFNKSYHLRTLNLNSIKKLFPQYEILKSFLLGAPVRNYNKLLGKIKHALSPSTSWIPNYWTPDKRRDTMCPNCGNSFDIPYKFHPVAAFCDSINMILSPKIPYQLCVLLEKRK